MTEREKQLIIGVLVKVYTGTLTISKSLDEECEDFVVLGEKLLKAISEQQKEEDNSIRQQIKTHQDAIKDLQYEMYIKKTLSVIPQTNSLNI
jgi:hypothetical protein